MRDLEKTYPDTNKNSIAYIRFEMKKRFLGDGFVFPSILMDW
jgi:hypothetical protein